MTMRIEAKVNRRRGGLEKKEDSPRRHQGTKKEECLRRFLSARAPSRASLSSSCLRVFVVKHFLLHASTPPVHFRFSAAARADG
jgi:hypothetical protein